MDLEINGKAAYAYTGGKRFDRDAVYCHLAPARLQKAHDDIDERRFPGSRRPSDANA